MTEPIKQRTFYLESEKKQEHINNYPVFIIKASENGRQINEYKNGQISQYYQADIFGVLAVVSDLIKEGYKGQIIIYLNSKLIVEEHEGNPSEGWYGFKEARTEDLKDAVKHLDKRAKRRWWYASLAHFKARDNGIDLVIKHLPTNNIKLVNNIMRQLLPNQGTATREGKK